MKRFVLLSVAAACLAGCHHLGDQESYTLIDEEEAIVQQPAPAVQQPVYRPAPVMMQPIMQQPYNCIQTPRPAFNAFGGCQMTPVSVQPQMIRIPEQAVCIR